jgi:hypothetical protein
MGKKKKPLKMAVLDFETDPFLHGRIPVPFSWGFYDGERYVEHWETNAWDTNGAVKVLLEFLENVAVDQQYMILAHNGGKFDFLFFVEHLQGAIKIVNGRILQAEIFGHMLRDSYAILPVPLGMAGDKLDIDYKLMERGCREDHKPEILGYQKQDCIALYNLCKAFYEEFGDNLTIGSTAMKELKKFHPYQEFDTYFDSKFRPFYFGGRCQCFEVGVIDTHIEVYDLNSSYPYTMRSMLHPVSYPEGSTGRIGPRTAFVTWEGENFNGVPVRTKTGLDFTSRFGCICNPTGDKKHPCRETVPHFHTTIHEFNAGLDTGTIAPKRILEAIHFSEMTSFDSFIEHFYTSRLKAKADGDKFHDLFYKLILNSAYGKFAQSPDNFEDSIILPFGDIPDDKWFGDIPQERRVDCLKFSHGEYAIWGKPSKKKTYFNVATAASITGGSRATLLRGLAQSARPLYCDTDSIFCESFDGDTDNKRLGAWKLEYEGSQMAIAGKKLYALMGEKVNKETGALEYGCLKKASKGTQLNPLAIFMIARGDTCETRNDAPAFKLDGKHVFISRNIRRTTLGG